MIPDTLRPLVVPIDQLEPYPDNPRQGDIGAIVQSLEHHGQYRPLVVNRRNQQVLAGNHTLAAARQLGWTEIAATYVDVNDEEARRIVLVDNRTNDLAAYDDRGLADLLLELASTSTGLAGTGFDGDDLEQLLADLNEPVRFRRGREGNVGAYPDNPEATTGDAWQLGDHILVCGDAALAETYQHLPEPASMIWTDPPYGVDLQRRNLNAAQKGESRNVAPITADDFTKTVLRRLWTDVFTMCRRYSADDCSIYTCAPQGVDSCGVIDAAGLAGFGLRHSLIWIKDQFVFGRADYHYRHELILYGWAAKHRWNGDRKNDNIFEIPRARGHELHPTSKPVALIEPMIENSSDPGNWVLEPFAGSGSTLIACENTGRRCYSIEIDPGYIDIIIDRFRSVNPDSTITRL